MTLCAAHKSARRPVLFIARRLDPSPPRAIVITQCNKRHVGCSRLHAMLLLPFVSIIFHLAYLALYFHNRIAECCGGWLYPSSVHNVMSICDWCVMMLRVSMMQYRVSTCLLYHWKPRPVVCHCGRPLVILTPPNGITEGMNTPSLQYDEESTTASRTSITVRGHFTKSANKINDSPKYRVKGTETARH